MTDIDTMAAGPEMDYQIATKVMGWKATAVPEDKSGRLHTRLMPPGYVFHYLSDGVNHARHSNAFMPSTRIDHAWEVVEKIRPAYAELCLDFVIAVWSDSGFRVGFMDLEEARFMEASASAETAPLAICRVALKAVGHG